MVRAGQLIGGKYRLIHPLGMGGMGMVWRAEHETLKQPVALKLLRGEQPQSAIKRFQREAQIAASIRHRNIVYISDFGIADDGPFLVMELLHGVPLSERLYVGEPLSVLGFLALMDETLQGLAAVHAAGIVHRDMKPANVFLVRDADGSVHPKLLDFGVSRSTDREQGHTITVEGMVMGTPEYISPEQARGKVGDQRSDLYSLGVLIYEALSGCLPFRADNTADLMVALLNHTPVPLHALRAELGQPLSDVVMRAIQRDPARRYQSTADMRAALAACANESLAKLMLPARVAVTSPSPVISSEPPRPEPVETALSTALMPVSASRRWLLPASGLVALGALALTFATRSPSAGASLQRDAVPTPLLAPTPLAEQDAGAPEPVRAQPEDAGAGDDAPKSSGPARRARASEGATRPRAKVGKRELLRNPGF